MEKITTYKQFTIIRLTKDDPNYFHYIGLFATRRDVYNELGYHIFVENTKEFLIILNDNVPIGISAVNIKGNVLNLTNSFINTEYKNKGIYNFIFDLRIDLFKKNTIKIKGIATALSEKTYKRNKFCIKRKTKKYTFFERIIK